METVFLSLLNRSMAAGWLILAVVALRLPLKKAPRWITAALWGLVAVRLICPFSFESRFSLLPGADAIPPAALTAKHPAVGSGSSFLDPSLSESLAPQEIASVNPLQVLLFAASLLWIAGMLVMLLYALVSSLRLGRRVREARPAAGQSVGLRPYSDRLYPWCAASPHLSALHHEGSR